MKRFMPPPRRRLSLPEICAIVEARYRLPRGTLRNERTNAARICEPRQIAWYMARENGYSGPEIGKAMNYDVSTVTHAHAKVAAALREQPEVAMLIEELQVYIDAEAEAPLQRFSVPDA